MTENFSKPQNKPDPEAPIDPVADKPYVEMTLTLLKDLAAGGDEEAQAELDRRSAT